MNPAPRRSRKFLIFTLGDTRFGLPIEAIAEIVQPRPLTVIPKAPAFLRGLMRLREQVVPVLDLRERFGLPAAPSNRWVIVKRPSLIAYQVDRVDDVADCPEGGLQPAPAAATSLVPGDFIEGVLTAGDQGFVLALRPEMLISQTEQATLGQVLPAELAK
jgi:purine-binding chemotaxis protein CheW